MTGETHYTEAEASFNHGMQCAEIEVRTLDGQHKPFFILPRTGEVVDLSKYLDDPLNINAEPRFIDLESFCAYATRFKTPGAILRGFPDQGKFVSSLDYHEPEKPSRCQHSVTLDLTQPDSFKDLLAKNDKPMNQLAFVEFLEDHAKEIRDPDPAGVLEIARDLSVSEGKQVKSTVRNGANMTVQFTGDTAAAAANGAVLPTKLLFSVQPYEGMPARFDIEAVLRVRVNDGNLSFRYILRDITPKVQDAFRQIGKTLEKATAIPVFI